MILSWIKLGPIILFSGGQFKRVNPIEPLELAFIYIGYKTRERKT
jgi:hypothetical protein